MTTVSGAGASAPPAPPVWTIDAVVRWATDDFRARGIDSPRLDAEVLLAHALGATRIQLITDARKPLAPEELARFRDLVKRRRAREPVAYLLGAREFFGRSFKVDRRVLVPRPDTETLVEVGLERTRAISMSMRALDLCTGSGCVAVSLARERPTGCVVGADVSEEALAVARENAHRLGATNTAFVAGDLYEALGALRAVRGAPKAYDLVTANPPYIATSEIAELQVDIREFEPRVALDGGDDGLDLVRRIAAGAGEWLAPGGVLAMEIGAGQAEGAKKALEDHGFVEVATKRDYGRIERVVSGVHARSC